MLALHLRFPEKQDLPAIAALLSEFNQEATTVTDVQAGWANRAPESRVWRRVAVTAAGEVRGYASGLNQPWHPAGQYALTLVVDPAQRRQGVGRQLAGELLAWTAAEAATRLNVHARDDDPAALAFARLCGFRVAFHSFTSALTVSDFDEALHLPVLKRVEGAGIRFSTLAAEGQTEENKHALYELNRVAGLDVPDSDGTFPPYEFFETQVYSASWFDPAGQVLALDGEQYVGLGALGVNAESGVGSNAFTGVHPDYRGRGLATALKLLVVQEARRRGVRVIETGNNSLNAPILAINRKFGYRPRPGLYTLTRP